MKLGEVSKVQGGYAFKSQEFQSEGVPIIRIGNLDGKSVGIDYDVCYPREFWEEHPEFRIEKNSILIAMSGATVGKVGLFESEEKALLNQRVCILRPNENAVANEYLYFYCLSPTFKKQIEENAFGCAQPNISASQICNFEINVPTKDEQRKCVEQLQKIKSIITQREGELVELDNLIKSRFVELFGDLKNNPFEWDNKNLLEVADIDTVMVNDYEKYANFPHIGIDSIEKNTGKLFGYRTIAEDGVISGKYLFTSKHIIYSKIRPNLNKVAMPDFEGLCSADAYPILPKEDICLRIYLGYVMRSDFFLDYILPFSRRANMPKVNKEQLSGFSLPVPPMELQIQFEEFVHQVDKLKFTYIKKQIILYEGVKCLGN